MSAQLSIAYDPGYVGAQSWERHLAVVRTVVEHLGRKEVAFVLDVSGSQLSDAMSERDRKRWAGEWTHKLFAMLEGRRDEVSHGLSRQLAESSFGACSWLVDEPVAMSLEEENAALRRELAGCGEAGRAAVERIKRRKK